MFVLASLTLVSAYGIHLAGSSAEPQAAHNSGAPDRVAMSKTKRHGCAGARRAIRYYRNAYTKHRQAMGLVGAPPLVRYGCGATPRRAVEWRERARAARRALAVWTREQYAWQDWLPANWQALGACETGYGRRPGNWHHDSGQYVSAFGIERHNYALDAHRIGNLSWDETIRARGTVPTPREQYDAAVSHYRTYGDGWGCPGP